jgi:hypothetical protein
VSTYFRILGFRITRAGDCELDLETSEGVKATATVDKGLMDARSARLIPALLGTVSEAARTAGKPPEPEPEPVKPAEKGKWIEPGDGGSV